ncbi:hypothetical protein SPHV1_2230061 [Novosphingobium sp. KN65.2]|nr:hypothetical protein SPHV1_2230061 [Novosphingobium sp. KN65.2]
MQVTMGVENGRINRVWHRVAWVEQDYVSFRNRKLTVNEPVIGGRADEICYLPFYCRRDCGSSACDELLLFVH